MFLEKRTFEGGMDQDSDERVIAPGDYRYAFNCRIGVTDGSNNFSVENLKGNLLVSYTLPSGTNTTIGNYDDKQNNKVYYFVHNSLGNHLILEYSYLGTIALVLQSSVLNFNTSSLIVHVNVIEGELSWTDDYNPPRAINIAKAKLHSSGNFTSGYPSPFIDEYCRAIRFAPECEPTCAYADDTTKNVNYLSNKLFQFKYRYWYFDYQCSTWSAISTVPLPAIVCGNTSVNASKNCLINITTETGSPICTRIEIAARIGNTGDFFSVADLDKAKLNISSNTTNVFAFYNEKIYNNVDIKESILLFDNMPLKAKAQEIIENRRVYGNVLEGQDPVEIDAKLTLGYTQDISLQTYSITGLVYIKNPFSLDAQFARYQPIHNFSNDGNSSNYVWGGIGPLLAGVSAPNDFQQNIPLGGFVFYLAGTPYKGVSRQVAPQNGGTQDANGVYASDGAGVNPNSHRNKLRDEVNAANVYSQFTISGIPPGTYIMRVAGHQTTQPELDNPARPYEKTSTNTLQVGGYNDNEIRIQINQNGTATVNGVAVTVSGNTISIGPTDIMDLTGAGYVGTTAITGYLTDCDIQPTPTSYAALLADTRIDKGWVHLTNANSAYNGQPGTYTRTGNWSGSNAVSVDHNGYYFFSCDNFLSGSVTADAMWVGGSVNTPSNYDTSGGGFGGGSGNAGFQIVSRAPGSLSPFNNYRTTATGVVVDPSGNPIEGASVAIGHAKVDQTDASGTWSTIIYANSGSYPSGATGVRDEYINYALADTCVGQFAGSPDYFNIAIDPTTSTNAVSPYGGHYNNGSSVAYLVVSTQTVVIVGGGVSTKSDKRGGVYQYGVVYYNDANQSGLTNTRDGLYSQLISTNGYGLRMEIPFYTEGSPIVGQLMPETSWQIFSLPPAWATHWQWVRTLNSATNNYIQFVAKRILPVYNIPVPRTVTSFGNAVKLGIDISNITLYNSENGDTTGNVTYDFTEGDRVRFIRDGAGNFYGQYFDFKITDWDPAGIIYIDYVAAVGQPTAGCLVEIYTPKKDLKEELYYEIGECYEVGNPGQSNRYHKGPTQDQDPNNPVTAPASGTFGCGDTYYRMRSMGFLNSSNQLSYASRIIEDPSFSDFFPSRVIDIGRPNRVDNQYRQVRRPTTIYHTGILIPETFVNNLNRVYDVDFETYDRAYGSIQRLYSDNHVLEVYQEKKCCEVPINVRYLYNADGVSQVVTTDSFFNEAVYSAADWGIYFNPESFAAYGNSRYFIDIARGAVIRKNIDGLTPISEYKMHNFFTNLSKQYLQKNIIPKVYGAYDRRFEEYVLCFAYAENVATRPPLTMSAQTWVFSEKRNRWVAQEPYEPENIGTAGMDVVSFKNGALWAHNQNPVYGNFYGVQYDQDVWVISNADPSKIKIFLAMSTESTHAWEMTDGITPSGQSTNLLSTDFQLREDIYYADFLRDVNSVGVADPLINGDPMRGASMLLKLRNSATTLSTLFAVNVGVIPSERSNR